jgi:hypothetical protein
MEERNVTLTFAGHEYTIWYNDDGMTHVACKGRWPKAKVGPRGEGIGDDWLETNLRGAMISHRKGH